MTSLQLYPGIVGVAILARPILPKPIIPQVLLCEVTSATAKPNL